MGALLRRPETRTLEGLARFLLRSEAIASSRIEGMQVAPQQLALAELAQSEQLAAASFTRNAQLVANNITTLRRAASDLATAPSITAAGTDDLHHALLPDEQHRGQRTVQNWIGGNDWHPLDAQFVLPPPEHVSALMDDLVQYTNGGTHAALIQAALAHPQFETIHPYTDGNGRVGRALIHTVLTRRGLTPSAVLPLSLVLLTRSDAYLDGLTAYRHDGAASSADAQAGLETWLWTFLDAAELAVEQVVRFTSEIAELQPPATSPGMHSICSPSPSGALPALAGTPASRHRRGRFRHCCNGDLLTGDGAGVRQLVLSKRNCRAEYADRNRQPLLRELIDIPDQLILDQLVVRNLWAVE